MTRKATARVMASEAIIENHREHDRESVTYWEGRAERVRNILVLVGQDRVTIGRRSRTLGDMARDGAE